MRQKKLSSHSGLNDYADCPPTSGFCPEDLNSDGAVSTADLLIFLSAFGILAN